jgi:hypothetical protein
MNAITIPCAHSACRGKTGIAVLIQVAVLSIMAAGLYMQTPAQIRVAQIGSNPFLSAELFPQDMQEWPITGFSYSPSYAKLPFWGRIDDPLGRPDGNYTSTGLGTENFSHTANVFSITNGFSYTHSFSPRVFMLAGLDADFDARYNGADGVLHGDPPDSVSPPPPPMPFKYSMLHTLGMGRFTGAGAFRAFGVPAGARLQFGVQNTATLDHTTTFTKDGTEYSSKRATWGWTTTGCAHVFGLHNPEADTWLQDGYATGPLYSVDLQAGATLPFGKAGLRFSTLNGHQDYYSWRPDSSAFGPDTVINRNFIGHYEKQDWSRTTGGLVTSLYTNYILRTHDLAALGLFGRITYTGLSHGEALSGNLDVTNDDRESMHGFSLDVAPNLTIPFGSFFSYIDIAVPIQYGYARKSNTYMRWVGGGQIRTYWNTRTSNDDENVWEPFSYANQHDIGMGIDFNTMFPLMNAPAMKLGLGVQLLINACATFTGKSYGNNTDDGSTVNFTVEKQRFDYEGRKQFATGVKLQFMGTRSLGWFEITEPLLQAVRPVTKVTDASGDLVFYEHEKSPLWLSMQGLRFGFYYTRQMTIHWLSRFDSY